MSLVDFLQCGIRPPKQKNFGLGAHQLKGQKTRKMASTYYELRSSAAVGEPLAIKPGLTQGNYKQQKNRFVISVSHPKPDSHELDLKKTSFFGLRARKLGFLDPPPEKSKKPTSWCHFS